MAKMPNHANEDSIVFVLVKLKFLGYEFTANAVKNSIAAWAVNLAAGFC